MKNLKVIDWENDGKNIEIFCQYKNEKKESCETTIVVGYNFFIEEYIFDRDGLGEDVWEYSSGYDGGYGDEEKHPILEYDQIETDFFTIQEFQKYINKLQRQEAL